MESRGLTPRTKKDEDARSDASCFAVYADPPADANPVVECADCGKRAIGANFQEFLSGGFSGRPSGIVRFSCGCALERGTGFAISAATLFPQWRLVSEVSAGTWRIVKTTKEEREKACKK